MLRVLSFVILFLAPAVLHAETQVYTCDLVPVSQHKSEWGMDFRLTVAADGAAKLEGIKSDWVQVRDRGGKVRANWGYRDYKVSSTIDKATKAARVNMKREGFIGTLRWKGTCR